MNQKTTTSIHMRYGAEFVLRGGALVLPRRTKRLHLVAWHIGFDEPFTDSVKSVRPAARSTVSTTNRLMSVIIRTDVEGHTRSYKVF